MKISTKGRYAICLMIDIAKHSDEGNVSIKEVARRQSISLKYLEQIVNMLSKAGFLKSRRGLQGGYKLTRLPKDYTVGDILRVTEGKLIPVDCIDDEIDLSANNEHSTIKLWKGLYDVINQYLDSITIADLINEEDESQEYLYYI